VSSLNEGGLEGTLEQEREKEKAKSRSSSISSIATKVSMLATGFAGFMLLSTFVFPDADQRLRDTQSQIFTELRAEVRKQTNSINTRLSVIEKAITGVQDGDLADSIASSRVEDNSSRIDAVEDLLDLEPRQIIELTKLRDEILDLRSDFASQQSQLLREVDRAYSFVIALIVSLLVAVVAAIIPNFLRRNIEK